MKLITNRPSLLILLFCLPIVSGTAESASAQSQPETDYRHSSNLSVITVGSGIPGPSPKRSEPMTVIQHNGRYIVIDCGYTSGLKFLNSGMPTKNIDIIMFTHLHADHTSDFFNLMTWRFLSGGRGLEIIGPPRTGQLYEFYRKFYRDDIIYRTQVSNIKTSAGSLSGVAVREIKGSQKINIDDISIESAEMVHTMYDLAYRFTIDGKIIVVSGDTSYNEKLINMAKNADLLVIDGSFIINALNPPEDNPFKDKNIGQRKIDGVIPVPADPFSGRFTVESHMSYSNIIKTAAEAKPKKFILTHLFSEYDGNPDPNTKENFDRVRSDLKKAGFKGDVYFAEDGMEVDIP